MQEGLQPLSAVLRASKSGRVKRDEDKLWIPSSLRLFALPRYIYTFSRALLPSRDGWSYQVMHPLVKNPPPWKSLLSLFLLASRYELHLSFPSFLLFFSFGFCERLKGITSIFLCVWKKKRRCFKWI